MHILVYKFALQTPRLVIVINLLGKERYSKALIFSKELNKKAAFRNK